MQTALISALTAAVVTLMIEYFAKPALEARKDRLVSASRARREMVAALDSFDHLLMRLSLSVSHGDWASVATLFKTIDDKAAKLSEHHAEARRAIGLSAAYIAGKALTIVHSSIAIMEWSIHDAKEVHSTKGEEFEAPRKEVGKLDFRIGQAVRVVEILYQQDGFLARIRRQNIKQAEWQLALLDPKENLSNNHSA